MSENRAYIKHFKRLRSKASGYSDMVGGYYEEMGYLQRCLLQYAGLQKDNLVVDVGCGTGRLASQLSEWGVKSYWGFDVVKGMLKFARKQVSQPEYVFDTIEKEHIKMGDDSVDFVCFFSVFTHLPHHNSFRYLLDALRVLNPGGRVVFSFLSYDCEYHWPQFIHIVGNRGVQPMTQLMAHSQIEVWSRKLGTKLIELNDGGDPFFPIDQQVVFEKDHKLIGLGTLGQSVCILEKPANWEPNLGNGN